MRKRLSNQFPDPSTVKYSEISISFNGTNTNKLCAIRRRWLKTYCGAVDGKDIPLGLQPLKNFIQKFCSTYSEDKNWEDPHRPIIVREVPQAVQKALPIMLQVASWPIDIVKTEVPLNQEADAEHRSPPAPLPASRPPSPSPPTPAPSTRAPTPSHPSPPPASGSQTPSPPTAAGPIKTEVPNVEEEEQLPNYDNLRSSFQNSSSAPTSPPASPSTPPGSKSATTSSPIAASPIAHPRVSPVEESLKAFLAAHPIGGSSSRELFTNLYNPKGGLTFTFFQTPYLFLQVMGLVEWFRCLLPYMGVIDMHQYCPDICAGNGS